MTVFDKEKSSLDFAYLIATFSAQYKDTKKFERLSKDYINSKDSLEMKYEFEKLSGEKPFM